MPTKPFGRPVEYTDQKADEICSLVAAGSNIHKICKRPGMPTRDTVYRWLSAFPYFSTNYARAREHRADLRFEKIDQVVVDMRKKKIDAQQARVEIDALKWQAGKEAPKRYGDRLELAGDADNPITVSVAETIRAARRRRLLSDRSDTELERPESEQSEAEGGRD